MLDRTRALRLAQLVTGLLGWGLAIVLFIRAGLGLGPWDAFHYGLHLQTGLTIGQASIGVGLLILGVTGSMGLRPGLGTVLNMVLIGLFVDLLLPVVPEAPALPASLGYFGVAIVLTGLCSGMYIGAGFGHGPRDGLMVALALRSGWSVRRIRTLIEASALTAGWLMGGTVGIGTLVIVLTIGHAVHWGLALFGALPGQHGDGGETSARPGRGPRKLGRAA